jgi:tRNA A-37 threonylcarbamoyl transferase component Bud32
MFSHFLRKVIPFGRWAAPRTRTVSVGARTWHLTPEADSVLGPAGPDLDRWLADGLAAVVKSNPQRTVYRVMLPGGTVYVKHCRINGPRAWAREVLRPAKARLEFENALALRDRGIPAVVPLAWGRPRAVAPGESFVITLSTDGAVLFLDFIEKTLPALPPAERTAVRRRLARSLGEFMARLHDAGVAHPDPHPGNLLVELPGSHVPRFHLIDLHAVRIGRPLSWAASRANLVIYNRWFQLRASRADRLRFWHAYGRNRRSFPSPADRGREVERATLDSNLAFWTGRMARCQGNNRYFRRVKAGSFRGFAVRDLPDAVVAELAANPEAVFARPDVAVLKDSRTSTVVSFTITTPDGPRAVVFKRVNVRRWAEPVKNLLRPSPALRSWVNGHALRDRWLPTPRPLLVLHRYRHGLPAEGYLLAERVPDARPLTPEPGALNAFARVLRAMHDRGVSHRDLKAPNVLGSHGEPTLIDLVGVRIGRPVPFHQRCRELARLNASFLTSSAVTRSTRLRFLRTYLAAGPTLGPDWKTWWRTISRATARKVAKNLKSGRPLA